jgi:hypothetical protein
MPPINDLKKIFIFSKKGLHRGEKSGIIFWRDCTRYALKQEVAAFNSP